MAEEFLNQISAKCSVIIIGAGQAGLSIAHSLQKKGIKPISPLDVLDIVLMHRKEGAFILDTWTL